MSSHHRVDFWELPALDLDAAKAFYAKAFGWTFKDYGPHYADVLGAGVSGGLRPSQEPPPRGGALVIVYSDDLAATEQSVIAAGGRVTSHHDFPGGRRFQFLDPSGNELAVWTKTAPHP